MGNYRTNRQKAKLFEDLIFEVYKMPKGGHSLTLKERDVVLEQIRLIIPKVDLLTPDVCQKMVTGIKDCLEKACQGQWNARFDWIKMVMDNIQREAMNTIKQKTSEDQETSTSLLTLEVHSTPGLTQRLPTKSTGKSKAKASMDNRGSNHDKWMLFGRLRLALHNGDAPDPVRCCIPEKSRHFVIGQTHVLTEEINYLSYSECEKIVADLKNCLKRALEVVPEEQAKFDYIKMATDNIIRRVKNVTAQRRYYNQTGAEMRRWSDVAWAAALFECLGLVDRPKLSLQNYGEGSSRQAGSWDCLVQAVSLARSAPSFLLLVAAREWKLD
ncbi:hypothetical protein IWZ01DRAFT_486903 [Phyllosticta capitalensis]